jgi:hypothetical protein
MELKQITERLGRTRSSLDSLDVPSKPGVYAIYIRGKTLFPLQVPQNGLIYFGSSNNLSAREFDVHFNSGQTGFSTLRRSLGAILKNELHLTAIPRGKENSASNYTQYRFEQDGEERLTAWMKDNLEVGVRPVDEDFEAAEKILISELRPILCLKGWPNPLKKLIKDMRKTCANEARQVRR